MMHGPALVLVDCVCVVCVVWRWILFAARTGTCSNPGPSLVFPMSPYFHSPSQALVPGKLTLGSGLQLPTTPAASCPPSPCGGPTSTPSESLWPGNTGSTLSTAGRRFCNTLGVRVTVFCPVHLWNLLPTGTPMATLCLCPQRAQTTQGAVGERLPAPLCATL